MKHLENLGKDSREARLSRGMDLIVWRAQTNSLTEPVLDGESNLSQEVGGRAGRPWQAPGANPDGRPARTSPEIQYSQRALASLAVFCVRL